jgi:hypothetical protein
MAYFKTRTGGELRTINGTTGAGAANEKMPNSGVSVIGNTTTEVFVLAPPVAGCRKTIVITSLTTTVLPVIRTSTVANGGGITFVSNTTGKNLLSVLGTRSTIAATVVELIGINSTSWVVSSVCPGTSDATINIAVSMTSGA